MQEGLVFFRLKILFSISAIFTFVLAQLILVFRPYGTRKVHTYADIKHFFLLCTYRTHISRTANIIIVFVIIT